MRGPRDLNSPLPAGKICNPDGTPVMQFSVLIRRLWERTGFAPGEDIAWLAGWVDQAVLAGAQAHTAAISARSDADAARMAALIRQQADLIARQQDALDTAMIAVARSQAREQNLQRALDAALLALARAQAAECGASKALETARDSAILALTARQR